MGVDDVDATVGVLRVDGRKCRGAGELQLPSGRACKLLVIRQLWWFLEFQRRVSRRNVVRSIVVYCSEERVPF